MDLQKTLEGIGLNRKEATIYLTLLEHGEISILDISNNCDLKRPTIYSGVSSLESMGLVRQTAKSGKSRYAAAPPSQLEDLIDSKKRLLENALPQLVALSHVPRGTSPQITYHDTPESLISWLGDNLSSAEDVLYASGSDSMSLFVSTHLSPFAITSKNSIKEIGDANVVSDQLITKDFITFFLHEPSNIAYTVSHRKSATSLYNTYSSKAD